MVFDWSIYPMFRLRNGDSSRGEEKLPVNFLKQVSLYSKEEQFHRVTFFR